MGQFYSNQHTDTAVDAAARRERNARIVEMLSSHSPYEVAEIVGVSASTVSQVARKAGLPPRWGNGKKNGKRKSAEPEMVIPPVVAEIINRPKPPKVIILTPARVPADPPFNFADYNGKYSRCPACFFSGWAKIGAETVCPRCKLPLQIVYTPGRGKP